MKELDVLAAGAMPVVIIDEPIDSRPGFCNNFSNDAQQIRDIRCIDWLRLESEVWPQQDQLVNNDSRDLHRERSI